MGRWERGIAEILLERSKQNDKFVESECEFEPI